MSDKKITELPVITGADLEDTDELVVVDISADTTKSITLGEFKDALDTATGFVRITGDTMTGDLTVPNVDVTTNITVAGTVDGRDVAADGTKLDTAVQPNDSPTFAGLTTTGDVSFGDNDKAIFGAGSDLEIYHDGSDSYIDDAGTGDLYLRSSNDLLFTNADGSETYARFQENGYARLFYDNALKLATTSTGVDVTGTVTMDGGSTSADFTFGDNDKAIFGAGSDLQIYHDGSQSYIEDAGTGTLNLKADKIRAGLGNQGYMDFYRSSYTPGVTGLRIGVGSSNQHEITTLSNIDLVLNRDTTEKLRLTSTGVNVTGTITATSFAGDGSALTGLPAGYTNADVDTHLNTSTAANGEVLSWTGTDYDWITAGASGGGFYKGERGTVGSVNGAGDIFRINEQELNTSTTIDADENASATGPLTVATGVTLTVTAGGNLSIV
jgi:hypothetical protein